MTKRILIVDDEEHIRRMMRFSLEAAGYQVGEAATGSEALDMFGENESWDVVFLDQRMPGMDGLQVLREMTNRGLESPVIVITAFASIELAVEAMKLGATDFVRKPMTPEVLRDAVTAALAKPRPRGQTRFAQHSVTPEAPGTALIHTITMNGFEILRPSETDNAELPELGERLFRVKNPRGWQRDVIVEISNELVSYVERITRRSLPLESSFWTARAERALATYLWNEGRFPDQRLQLVDLSPEELDVAARWERSAV